MARSGVQTFRATLYQLPSNYAHIMNVAMDVPPEVSASFATRGHVPVVGTADDVALEATLVPAGGGRHRLYLNQDLRRSIGKGVGDEVAIRIRRDHRDRMPPTPDDLLAALEAGSALDGWSAMRPSRRKELLVALADAKTAPTRTRRIDRIVAAAAAAAPGGP